MTRRVRYEGALRWWERTATEHPMLLRSVHVTQADLRRAFEARMADIERARSRSCPPGLRGTQLVDAAGHRLSVRARPDHRGRPGPLHPEHACATHRVTPETANYVFRVARRPGDGRGPGHDYYAVWELDPDVRRKRALEGEWLSIGYPAGHFEGWEIHGAPIEPDSYDLRHTPDEAYRHAMERTVIRDAEGKHYGLLVVIARDESGPTRYRLMRFREHQFFNRLSARAGKDDDGSPVGRGGGIDLTPAQVDFLRGNPPRTGVELHDGQPFAQWSRLAVPSVDADGRAIARGRLQVRYEVKLDPSVYGGDENFWRLRVVPYWKVEADEPDAEAAFRAHVADARRRFFAREADRPAVAEVDELLHCHGGDVARLLASGELGHVTVDHEDMRTRGQRTVRPRKPLADRDAARLAEIWKLQNPGIVNAIRADIQRRASALVDDAALDEAISRAVEDAIHRYSPGLGEFSRFARRRARAEALRAAQELAREHEAGRLWADAPEASDDGPGAGPVEDAGVAGVAAGRSTKRTRTVFRVGGSQSEADAVLERALPDDAAARQAVRILYPTLDFSVGIRSAGVAAASLAAAGMAELSGMPPLRLLDRLRALVDRVKRHPAYDEYWRRHLAGLEERRRAFVCKTSTEVAVDGAGGGDEEVDS